MSDVDTDLDAARTAYARRDWARAHAVLSAARDEGRPLAADDLVALAQSAWWLRLDDESAVVFEQAYQAGIRDGRTLDAARTAVRAGYAAFIRADEAVGSGWIGRAERLLSDLPDCAEQGYIAYAEVEDALERGDVAAALATVRAIRRIGLRHDDVTLVCLANATEGRVAVAAGRVREGLALVDGAMLDLLGHQIEPTCAGIVFCNVIDVCWALSDLTRAQRWTEAFERWLDTMPTASSFRGICRVHRAQLLHARGHWSAADDVTATLVSSDLGLAAAAEAWYASAELRRLRGDLEGAAEAYASAHRLGRDPQPGHALLLLRRGRVDAAAVSIRIAVGRAEERPLELVRLWSAQVEIALAGDDLPTAATASDALARAAETFASRGIAAMAAQACGAVRLAEGQADQALAPLHLACAHWTELDAPYEIARTRLLLAQAYRVLGDDEAAAMDADAAAEIFGRLGAPTDVAAGAAHDQRPPLPGGLTHREGEVLALVATGRSNRQVAAALVLSERTVARHLANIFAKLGVASRSAATAYAYEQGIASWSLEPK